ncbi:hypothetical protein EE612_042551, partial [Oryza sativa]
FRVLACSSPTLKSLWLESCSLVTSNGLAQMIAMAPLLEELVLSYCRKVHRGGGVYAAVAEACPRLRRLEVRRDPTWRDDDSGDRRRRLPFGIAAMRELRHLTLVGVAGVGDDELAAIVDGGCPHLEVLHVSECPGLAAVDVAALRAKCGGVKELTLHPCVTAADDDQPAEVRRPSRDCRPNRKYYGPDWTT